MPSAKAKGKEEQGGEDPHLHDFFAALAMMGLIHHFDFGTFSQDPKRLAGWAYEAADAMMVERKQRSEKDT